MPNQSFYQSSLDSLSSSLALVKGIFGETRQKEAREPTLGGRVQGRRFAYPADSTYDQAPANSDDQRVPACGSGSLPLLPEPSFAICCSMPAGRRRGGRRNPPEGKTPPPLPIMTRSILMHFPPILHILLCVRPPRRVLPAASARHRRSNRLSRHRRRRPESLELAPVRR